MNPMLSNLSASALAARCRSSTSLHFFSGRYSGLLCRWITCGMVPEGPPQVSQRLTKQKGPCYRLRMGVMMACSLESNLVPRLMEWPFGSSRGVVSSNGSRRTSRPTLGSRSSPERAISEPGGRSM